MFIDDCHLDLSLQDLSLQQDLCSMVRANGKLWIEYGRCHSIAMPWWFIPFDFRLRSLPKHPLTYSNALFTQRKSILNLNHPYLAAGTREPPKAFSPTHCCRMHNNKKMGLQEFESSTHL